MKKMQRMREGLAQIRRQNEEVRQRRVERVDQQIEDAKARRRFEVSSFSRADMRRAQKTGQPRSVVFSRKMAIPRSKPGLRPRGL